MRETVSALNGAGIRDAVKVIIGGSCVSEEFAKKISADGYAEDAAEAVVLVNNLLGK